MSDEKKEVQLNAKQAKFLKGLAHHLKPVVQVGKEGITDSVTKAVNSELAHHELIKIKIGQNSIASKQEVADSLAEITSCHVVQIIGKTVIAFKQNIKLPKDTRIKLPK